MHRVQNNATAMADIIEDKNAVYGFRPSSTGNYAEYASLDWSDKAVIHSILDERQAFYDKFEPAFRRLLEMLLDVNTTEEIVRELNTLCVTENIYDSELPVDDLYDEYGTWEAVLVQLMDVHPGLDACIGLYDKNYCIYCP